MDWLIFYNTKRPHYSIRYKLYDKIYDRRF
ncbi:transposase [bacterium]|nr:transposase [bacterium]